jgi:hypothetical protein
VKAATCLAHSVSICVEESEGVVGTAVHSQRHLGDVVVSIGSRLRSTDWALVAGAANAELVVVGCVWLEVLCFDLEQRKPQNSQFVCALDCRTCLFLTFTV